MKPAKCANNCTQTEEAIQSSFSIGKKNWTA